MMIAGNCGILPVIDDDKCINCNACVKTCPVNYKPKGNNVACYSAWSKNEYWQKKCASGGISSTIGERVINNGGVVFGTCYENGILKFSFAENLEKLKLFAGSKYVHAYVGTSFKKAKSFLDAGRQVLFVATPCQIAGLKNYLRKDYDNLILIDILCHGVMPQEFLQDYLDKNYDSVIFKGERGSRILAIKNEKVTYNKIKEQDVLFMAYAKGLLHRENCFNCAYANLERMGDLTIGDFWGYKSNNSEIIETPYKRVSLILSNTNKGNLLLDEISDIVEFHQRNINEALPFNKQLSHPCGKPDEREQLLKNYTGDNIKYLLKKTELNKIVRKNRINHLVYSIFKRPFKLIRKVIRR